MEKLAAHNAVKMYVIDWRASSYRRVRNRTEFVLLIMAGREASETDAESK